MSKEKGVIELEQVVEWLLSGHSEADINEALQEYEPRQDVNYEAACRFLAAQDPDKDSRQGWHIEARRVLLRKCIEISDYKAAHALLIDIAKLEGRYSRSVLFGQSK